MTPLEQKMRDQGAADAAAGRKATPPTMGGKAADAYTAGFASVEPKTDKGPSTPRSKSKARSGSARTPNRAGRRTTARGRARRRPTPYRKAARQLQAPLEGQLVSGMATIGTAVGIAVLFNLLQNAKYVGGVFDGFSKMIAWLDSPTSITYRE